MAVFSKTKGEYVRACALLRKHNGTHGVVHRNQQICLVLLRQGKSWSSKKAAELNTRYRY